MPLLTCARRIHRFPVLVVKRYSTCVHLALLCAVCDEQPPTILLYSRWRHAMKTITTDGLKALKGQNGDLTLINTLAADQFEKTKIPGATNIPLASSDFAARVEQEGGGKDKPIVVYCASQQCNSSEKAAEKLEA